MRYFIHFVLLCAVGACGWYLYDQSRLPTTDLTAHAQLDVQVPEFVRAVIEAKKNDEQNKISGAQLDVDCFVWGPFEAKQIVAVRRALKRSGLLQNAELSDRFLPDRWIVYLGPYDNDVAVRAFVKQFRQQGYRNVRPILQGALSYGVEIESFESREQAHNWMLGGKAPDVQGMRVTKTLGEVSDQVDLVFRSLTPEKRKVLFETWKKWKGTQIQNCGYYSNK